jgi:hypothetical protein
MVHQRATHRVLPLLVVAVLIGVGFTAMGGRAEAASATHAVGAGHSLAGWPAASDTSRWPHGDEGACGSALARALLGGFPIARWSSDGEYLVLLDSSGNPWFRCVPTLTAGGLPTPGGSPTAGGSPATGAIPHAETIVGTLEVDDHRHVVLWQPE